MAERRTAHASNTNRRLIFKKGKITHDEPHDLNDASPYGQRGFIPDYNQNSTTAFEGGEPDEEALEYLRSVRNETAQLPFIYAAPVSTQNKGQQSWEDSQNLPENTRVTYSNGVYASTTVQVKQGRGTLKDRLEYSVAGNENLASEQLEYEETLEDGDAASLTDSSSLSAPTQILAFTSYHTQLLAYFASFRERLELALDLKDDPNALELSDSLSHPQFRANTLRKLFLTTAPSRTSLSAVAHENPLPAISVLTMCLSWPALTSTANHAGRNLAAWTWVLLAAVRDAGILESYDVAIVRDLGKKAVRIAADVGGWEGVQAKRRKLAGLQGDREQEPEAEMQDVDAASDSHGQLVERQPREHSNVAGMSGRRRNTSSPLSSSSSPSPAPATQPDISQGQDSEGHTAGAGKEMDANRAVYNAFACLDMVITVVGELYGQRDLLSAREMVWGEYGGANEDDEEEGEEEEGESMDDGEDGEED